MKLSGDSHAADDITEDVFLHLLEEKPLFNDFTHLKAYLFRAARYKYMDALKAGVRAANREAAYTALQDVSDTTYLAQVMRAEIIAELRQAIDSLPPQAGKIITMTYLEGRSNQEVADALNLSVQTVKNQKRRGLDLLKNRLPRDRYLFLLLYAASHAAVALTA